MYVHFISFSTLTDFINFDFVAKKHVHLPFDNTLLLQDGSKTMSILTKWDKLCQNDVCFIKISSKHSSKTLLSLLQFFMKQTLGIQ